ncbi:MAG: type II toxin-antitoxin system VapC family toxin [Phycisphaerales bacterium]
MATVYIETTIPSFYFETRKSARAVAWREATRHWWDHCAFKFDLVTSDFVIAELRRAPQDRAAPALAMLRGVRVLPERPSVRDTAAYYIEQGLMPAGADGDTAHLAMASVHAIDFLLTWNCKHLANANKVPHLRALNARLGLAVPTLTTPFTLIPGPPL